MASTFSPNLKLELIGNGDQSGTWGTTTNTNLGTLLEQAITGIQSIVMTNADYTLTNLNGISDEARNAVLVVTGTNSAIRNIITPSGQNKIYIILNNTTGGFAIGIKAGVGGTVLSIASGATVQVYTDGTTYYSVTLASTSLNTANTLVLRDGSGNFAAGTITAGFIGSLTGNATTATNISGGVANAIPYQTSAGDTKFVTAPVVANTALTWNGTSIIWAATASASAGGAVYENTQTINTNYTMTSGKSGESVGPITVNSGITVTIPSGSKWVIL